MKWFAIVNCHFTLQIPFFLLQDPHYVLQICHITFKRKEKMKNKT